LLPGLLLAVLAQAQQLPIRYYTVADGLAEDRVNAIVPDSRGFVWIATSGGLSRFDGYRMKTYGVEDGLPNRAVNTLLETPSGAYLTASVHGLTRLENSGVPPFTALSLQESPRDVSALLREPSGRILVGSLDGLFESTDGNSFRRVPLDERVAKYIDALGRDREGNIWISSEKVLGVLSPRGSLDIFRPGYEIPFRIANARGMIEQPAGRMWTATNNGLCLFERRERGKWSLSRVFSIADGLAGVDMGAIQPDSEGRLWIATNAGISRFAPDAPLPPRFENLGKEQGLPGQRITSLARDAGGNMWAGTETAGVMRIARQGFLGYRKEQGLNADHVFQVLEDRSGELLTVTTKANRSYNTFSIFDGTGFRSIVSPSSLRDIPWGWQRVLLQAKRGDWWGTSLKGLARFPPMKAASLATAKPFLYPARDLFHIFEDSSGAIWASGNPGTGSELMRLDPVSGALSWFRPDGTVSAESGAFGALAASFAEDRSHNIWIGLWWDGLLRYSGGRFTRFREPDGIPQGRIFSLLTDHGGRLWIATSTGGLLLLADPTAPDPHFEAYNRAHGLSSDSIRCMVEDAAGKLYLGSARGVDRLDPETGHVRHFSSGDGVPYGGFTSAIRDRSGALWFGSNTGVYRLASVGEAAQNVPNAVITGLRTGGEDYGVSQLGENRIAGLRLGPSQNSVQVEFVAPNAGSVEGPEDLRYKFRLEGADDAWSEPLPQHSVDYRNLAAGSYRFLVEAVDSEGRQSANPAEVAFTILPPFWQRWWFELGLLGAALAAAYGLHAYRLEHILAIEKMRTAIATDLHDDIGASLAQIAVLSDVAQASSHDRAPLNSRIGTLARELLDSMNDIVWSIRSGDEGVESMTRRMREFSGEFLQPAGIGFAFDNGAAPAGLKLTLNSRRQIFLIYKECLHNALKHSGCANVRASFEVDMREAVLTVGDDGKGMNGGAGQRSPASGGGNGLRNMRHRAENLGGTVKFGDRPGGGVQVVLRLPVRKRTFGGALL
jgi:ligand-binding sensor domain-containing protein/signal transduction histidine kinase